MKTINGYPTKKAISELCDKHGLRTYPLDSCYTRMHSITFSRDSQNETALLVKGEIDKCFSTEFRPADSKSLTTGQIKIISKSSGSE